MPKCLVPAAIALLIAPPVLAQQPPGPAKPVRIIASQAPSGGIDTVCRIVAPKLSDALGQTVRFADISEVRSGLNRIDGIRQLLSAAPQPR